MAKQNELVLARLHAVFELGRAQEAHGRASAALAVRLRCRPWLLYRRLSSTTALLRASRETTQVLERATRGLSAAGVGAHDDVCGVFSRVAGVTLEETLERLTCDEGLSEATQELVVNLLQILPRRRMEAFDGCPDAATAVEHLVDEILEDLPPGATNSCPEARTALANHLPTGRRSVTTSVVVDRLDGLVELPVSRLYPFARSSSADLSSLCRQRAA